MYGWGNTTHGELGLGGIEEEHVLTPKRLDWSLAEKVTEASLGENHTLLLTNEGRVFSCGNNDYGQLGHDQPRKRPQPVSGIDAHFITHVACGSTHSMALNRWGNVFSWGSDSLGQLGQSLGETVQPEPKIIRPIAKYHIVQICCGHRHSLALANTGEILAWGANSFGQLGLGKSTNKEPVPKVIQALIGVPIAFITCGDNHSFAVSKSGAVYGWGRNTKGQLGLNDMQNKPFPTQLRTLRNIRVRYISCGEEFSTFLTLDGGVFTCGAGRFGQLGHGTNSNEILPRQIVELMGSTITQIACGREHSLAFVPSRGRVYSFGIGGSGQLGLRKPINASTPQVVLGPWVSPSGVSLVPNSESYKNLMIYRIFAGGNQSLVSVISRDRKISPYDYRSHDPDTQILTLTEEFVSDLLQVPSNGPVDQDTLLFLESCFRSLSCLNGSFLEKNDRHFYCTSKHHGVDIEYAERVYTNIARLENTSLKEMIWNCVVEDIVKNLSPSPPDVEALRIYLTLPLYHEFNNPKHHLRLQKPFANSVLSLTEIARKVLGNWWCMLSSEYFERLVNVFKTCASFILRNQNIRMGHTAFYDSSLVAMLDLLSFLNKLNHNIEGLKVPYDTFHINDLSDYLDVRMDYVYWLTDQASGKLFLCNYPFVFDAAAKLLLLETDQSIQMQQAVNEATRQALVSLMFSPNDVQAINQFLVITVSRQHLVDDALRELSQVDPRDLKKPLKVKFSGEEAEDAGGVTKEFFLLLLREILDPKYGMFKEYEETRSIWFSESSFEDNDVFFLIGIILGLAIYNFTIIDIPFPLALYKKLLNEPVGLVDLKGLDVLLGNSLQNLLDYEGDDFAEVFDLNFTINRDVFGEMVTIPLKPNGENVAVLQSNKQEYVDLYVKYIFDDSVKNQFEAFRGGFMKVCGGRVLQLFHSHELMQVVIGNENYDWHALEEATEYKNGYKSSDQTIRWFWEVVHEMSDADKKKFLLFLTGSYRIPIQGMKAIKIYIQPTNDDKYLPVAHTCFNLLDLPRYKTKERLRYKLLQAIQQTEGFSLV